MAVGVFAVLYVLFFTCRDASCGQAMVCWSSYVTSYSNSVAGVAIRSDEMAVQLPEDKFINVSLPASNGPDSYWTVNVSCVEHFALKTYLFLNSSDNLYYRLSVYGTCHKNQIPPDLYIQVLDQPSLPNVSLGIDEALLEVGNNLSSPVNISQLSDNCQNCRMYPLGQVFPGQLWQVVLDTSFAWTIQVSNSTTNSTICMIHHQFPEHSKYLLVLQGENCTLQHQNMVTYYTTYLPILYAMVAILCLVALWIVAKVIWWVLKDRGCFHNLHLTRVDRVTARDLGNPRKVSYGAVSSQETAPLNPQPNSSLNNEAASPPAEKSGKSATEPSKPVRRKRLASLDTFRGFSLMIMIFVNYGGGGYWFFNHSTWNGVTVADLVFPWFVWIMGVSIVFSYRGRRKDSLLSRLYQVLRRTVILFGLGLFLNNGFSLAHWRVPGVLQRFSITYFVVALTELGTAELYHAKKHWFTPTGRVLRAFRDITANVVQWGMILILEFLWLIITFLLPVQGCPTGYLGPGGLSTDPAHENCTGGAAGTIDRWLFHDNHIYQTPTAKETYKLLRPYDPEGVLGSLNSIVICFLGVQAGRIIISYRTHYNILIRFLIWGVLLCAVGVLLCEGQKNDGFIPLNKNLWSLSFILVMAGSGYILLALFYLLIDVILWWNGAPFKYPGMNSILVYVGSEVLQHYFPFSWKQQADTHLNLLAANLIAICLWIAIAYYWFRIDFFVKI